MRDGGRPRSAEGGGEPSEELILAAVRRAALHDGGARGAAPLRAVLAHLAMTPRSAPGRALSRQLERLRAAGLLERARAHGVIVWALTSHGAGRLELAEGAGGHVRLPESPQHHTWRIARAVAEQELERLAAALRRDVRHANVLLDALAEDGPRAPVSDVWLALGPRLLGDCRRVGSAWHCLHEWPEPDDARADRDAAAAGDALRAGRRNVALWSQGD